MKLEVVWSNPCAATASRCNVSLMETTSTQNAAHRTSPVWTKTGSKVHHNGELYLSEYTNCFTGQTIRKGWRMTGHDWFVFDANGTITHRAHSLTWAKMDAAA